MPMTMKYAELAEAVSAGSEFAITKEAVLQNIETARNRIDPAGGTSKLSGGELFDYEIRGNDDAEELPMFTGRVYLNGNLRLYVELVQ